MHACVCMYAVVCSPEEGKVVGARDELEGVGVRDGGACDGAREAGGDDHYGRALSRQLFTSAGGTGRRGYAACATGLAQHPPVVLRLMGEGTVVLTWPGSPSRVAQ